MEKVFGDIFSYENGGYRWFKRNKDVLSDVEWQVVDFLIQKIIREKWFFFYNKNIRGIFKILVMGVMLEKFWGISVYWVFCLEVFFKI